MEKNMRLTIFGATGRTGQQLVEQALSAGHAVTILVRDPAKVRTVEGGLNVLAGNIFNSAQVEQAIAGAEAVMSVLGPTQNKPTYEVSAGTEVILSAMKRLGVRRLIISTGAGVADANDAPGLFDHLIKFLLMKISRYIYEDMEQVVTKVRATDLDWTIVRVPMLTDDPRSGKIRVGYVGKGLGMRIGRADLADFMLRQLSDNSRVHTAPAISN
jgi:putative NADH-flavin reductase